MKKIFTLALATAAVVGVSAAPLSFKNAPQIKLTPVKEITANSIKTNSVVSRAAEAAPELAGGEYVAQFAMEFSDGFSSVNPQTAKATKDGDFYVLDLGLNNLFKDMTAKTVQLKKLPMEMQDGSTVDYWGIPNDGSQVVFEDVELNNGMKVNVYIGGCAVADMDAQSGAYGYAGSASAVAPMFDVSADGKLLSLIQYNWQGTTSPVTGIWLAADITQNGETQKYSVGLDLYQVNYYQSNATYSMTSVGEAGEEETIEGECYVWPVQYQIGSGYETYGVADCGGGLISIVDGNDANCYPNIALFYAGNGIYWGDAQNSSDNFVAQGSFSEKDGVKTIKYDDLSWLLGNGQELGYFTDTTITFGGNGAINDVAVDNSNAPVEYFNLQGVRVNEPAQGQIVIRRQGTEVSKVLVK